MENAMHFEPLVPKASKSRRSDASVFAPGQDRSHATLQDDPSLEEALNRSATAARKQPAKPAGGTPPWSPARAGKSKLSAVPN